MDISLRLNFSNTATPALEQADFVSLRGSEHHAVRGKTPGVYRGYGTFLWTNGVRALCVLFLRAKLQDSPEIAGPLLSGSRGSLAASLDYALDKQPLWLLDMFGLEDSGRAFASRLFLRNNRGMKRGGNVVISLNSNFIKPSHIIIAVDGVEVRESERWQRLQRNLEGADPTGATGSERDDFIMPSKSMQILA